MQTESDARFFRSNECIGSRFDLRITLKRGNEPTNIRFNIV
jgi:hypothetical protein